MMRGLRSSVVPGVVAAVAMTACTATSGRPKDASVGVTAPSDLCWSANIGGATQDGCGSRSFPVHDPLGLFSSNVQKKSADAGTVEISVEVDGQRVASNATSAAYGVAQVVVTR